MRERERETERKREKESSTDRLVVVYLCIIGSFATQSAI